MKRRILSAIREGWFAPVFEHVKMKDFFKRVLTIYNILDVFELDSKSTVALYGRNSYNWIAIYIACLLKGVRLLILHPNINKLEAVHIMLITNTNHIFIDDDLVSIELGRALFLQTVISNRSLEVIYEKNDKTNFKVLAEILVSSESSLHTDLRTLDTLYEEDDLESSIITATSGTEHGTIKWVESSTGSVRDLLARADNLVPWDSFDKVYSQVEFAESHYLTVLSPFVRGCTFQGSMENAEVVIEDTNSIEDMWQNNVNYLYSKRFLSFLFSISWMQWLFKRIAIRKVWNYYGKQLKRLVVYNSVMNERILSILVGNLPIYTTYGSQETNQLVAINDYSSEKKRLPYAVGTALPGLSFNTYENELEISGSTLFNKYVYDPMYTKEVRFRDSYITGDIGFFEDSILFVYGRKSAIYHNDFKLPIQLDKLERIIKAVPYFKEVVLLSTRNGLYLLVYPDRNFVEARGLGYLHLEELMNLYLNKITSSSNETADIKKIVVVTEPLMKTYDGKICRHYYN